MLVILAPIHRAIAIDGVPHAVPPGGRTPIRRVKTTNFLEELTCLASDETRRPVSLPAVLVSA